MSLDVTVQHGRTCMAGFIAGTGCDPVGARIGFNSQRLRIHRHVLFGIGAGMDTMGQPGSGDV